VINSYVSDCKAVGQDSQAIGGFNGPGNYRIENNYLEGAAENVLFGGTDPKIPDLVTSNIVFRHNHLRKPLEWRDPIVPAVTGIVATPLAAGGSLAAGNYAYRISAQRVAGQTNIASSAPSQEVSVILAVTGAVRLSWPAVPGAQEYLVPHCRQREHILEGDVALSYRHRCGRHVGYPCIADQMVREESLRAEEYSGRARRGERHGEPVECGPGRVCGSVHAAEPGLHGPVGRGATRDRSQ
jgi:hypothetical protein